MQAIPILFIIGVIIPLIVSLVLLSTPKTNKSLLPSKKERLALEKGMKATANKALGESYRSRPIESADLRPPRSSISGAGNRDAIEFGESEKSSESQKQLVSEAWAKWIQIEKDYVSKWREYEMSMESRLMYPEFYDYTIPSVQTMITSMSTAEYWRADEAPVDTLSEVADTEYVKAVKSFKEAFDKSEMTAKQARISNFSVEEQSKLEQAMKLLSMAQNPGASKNERATAYKRVIKILDELRMPVSPKVILEIEAREDLQKELLS